MAKKKKFKIGTPIGDLIVIKKAKSETKATYWHVRCKCGKNTIMSTRKLNSGKVETCGYCTKTRKDKSTFIK